MTETGGNVAGGAPAGVLDPLLSHTRRAQRGLDAETKVEVRFPGDVRVVGGLGAEERAEERGKVLAHLVAAAADARAHRGEHPRWVRARDVLQRAHPAPGDAGARSAPTGVDGGREPALRRI